MIAEIKNGERPKYDLRYAAAEIFSNIIYGVKIDSFSLERSGDYQDLVNKTEIQNWCEDFCGEFFTELKDELVDSDLKDE